ncbi:hypothetical protein [Okeania sp.]|uniref:hypothetical protein n=1 Tax=Okeania sp. TaxID=3100323 RepID=UPI002B4AAD77|nr:hypothetical protein [Okeania sp.]MEB3340522.1 hypothetical protein [Okeania sp.]
MKKSHLITTLILGCVLAITGIEQANSQTSRLPYCSAASNQGGAWWTWTQSSIPESCYTAYSKLIGWNQKIDWHYKGYYRSNGLNKGKILCNQGKSEKKVIGTGKDIFENGINMGNQLGWKGCVIIVE